MEKLERLRKEIDKIDEKIIGLLTSRMNIVKNIAKVKARRKLDVFDLKREKAVLKRSKQFKNIFKEIIKLSKMVQKS